MRVGAGKPNTARRTSRSHKFGAHVTFGSQRCAMCSKPSFSSGYTTNTDAHKDFNDFMYGHRNTTTWRTALNRQQIINIDPLYGTLTEVSRLRKCAHVHCRLSQADLHLRVLRLLLMISRSVERSEGDLAAPCGLRSLDAMQSPD